MISDIPNVLSIAGSDPSGGAGIQADLKTIGALGGYGMSVLAALTAQNTRGVTGVHIVPANFVKAQIDAVFDDVRVDALKTGMIGSPEIIAVVVEAIKRYKPAHVVVDPVMVAQSGGTLADAATIEAIRSMLIPVAHVITPNIPEAEILLGRSFDGDMEEVARDLLKLGAGAVFLKGGHNKGAQSIDFYRDGEGGFELSAPRLETKNNHGTGCSLASALATFLAQGMKGADAARAAKDYVHGALAHADALIVGHGSGPINHFWRHFKK